MQSTHYNFQILMELKFLNIFAKNTQISNLIKIRPVADQLVHADGQTDMTKLTVPFRCFAKVPNLTQDIRLNSVGEDGSRITLVNKI